MGLPFNNPFAESSIPPVVLLIIYFIATMLSIANYVAYVRYNEDTYGEDLVRGYLAFTVLGTMTYALFSGVMWTWAAKYVPSAEQRVSKLSYGLYGIFLFHDMPIYIMEYHCILCCGWRNPFFGFVFVIHYMTFIISFVFVWFTYAWQMAKFMELNFGSGPQMKTGAEQLQILPPAPGSQRGLSSNRGASRAPSLGGMSPPGSRMGTLQQPMLDGASPVPVVKPLQMQPLGRRGSGASLGYFDTKGDMVWHNGSEPTSPMQPPPRYSQPSSQRSSPGRGFSEAAGANGGSMHNDFSGPRPPTNGHRMPSLGSSQRDCPPVTFQWSPRDDDEFRAPSTRSAGMGSQRGGVTVDRHVF